MKKQNKGTDLIRILHVVGNMDRNGAESMIMNYYREIDRSLYQFDFIIHGNDVGDFEKEIDELGGQIYTVPKYRLYNHLHYKSSWRKLLNELDNHHIIHSHIRSTASIFIPLASELGYRTIVHSHNTSSGKGIKGIIRDNLQKNITKDADELLACGIDAGKWLFRDSKREFKVIPNAIKSDKFRYKETISLQKRNELNLDENDFVYVHIGRFHEQKNHKFLIDTFEGVVGNNPNSILILVGDGELKKEIERYVENKRLSKNVMFLGVRDDVPEILTASDFMIMPSLYEGLPVTLVEAQAAGLVIFASDKITKEVNITNEINYIPLELGPSEWSKKINTYNIRKEVVQREEMNNIVLNSEYEIKNAVQKLLKVYTD